jgi:general secretion pathway protein D/MSHA biogenesis protein MshL
MGAEFITQDGKVDLGDVIKAMAEHKGFSVSFADDVDQVRPVDCHVKAADNFYDALDNILRQLDYYYEIEEDTIVVRYKESKTYNLSMPNFSESLNTALGGNMLPSAGSDAGDASTGLVATATLNINSEEFSFWDDLEGVLTSIVNCDGCPAPLIDRTLGAITVTASKRVHKEVEEQLAIIEKEAYKQVIIEVALTEDHATGIDWENVFSGADLSGKEIGGMVGLGDGTTGLLYEHGVGWNRFLDTISINDVPWSVVVSAFSQYGDTRIVANPKVHILNGHGAVMSAGQVTSYLEGCDVSSSEFGGLEIEAQVSSITEGLSVGIKANIVDEEEVVLYVFPAITRLIELRQIFSSQCGEIEAPEMAVREMATYAKVRNQEILVIGGLIQENNGTDTKKVPIMGDLPFLGKFFTYERIKNKTTELVILLKPRILMGE